MPSEADFLAAMSATPNDRAVRLVYADWLEDHDDPRAELIRIEEERRTLPAFADRYWAMKPRRNQLRAGAAQPWLTALGYGGYEPTFRVIPDGWRERWRLIREFHERWHGQPLPDVGGDSENVARLERIFGRQLPASVHAWGAFHRDIASGPAPYRQGDFIDDDEPRASGAALVIFTCWVGHSSNAYLAVLEKDLHHDDPPIYASVDASDNFTLATRTVTGLVLQLTTGYALEGASGFRRSTSSPSTVAELTTLFGPAQTIEGSFFFEARNLLVRGFDQDLWLDYKLPPDPASIPPLLFDYAAGTSRRYGVFLDPLPHSEDVDFPP